MDMTEVPRDQWQTFCDMFNRQHHGWLTSIEQLDTQLLETAWITAELQAEVVAKEMPFQGLLAEPENDAITLTVMVGERTRHIAHPVRQPLRMLFQQTPEGAHQGLRIDQAAGQSTLIRFRAPALPQELDGLAESER